MRVPWLAAVLLATALAGSLTGALAGCRAGTTDGSTAGGSTPSAVVAFPRPPHAAGPFGVTLQPGLRLLGTATCRQSAGIDCVDGAGYRALGDRVTATVQEVVTWPSPDHGSWRVVVRFAPGTRDAVRSAAGAARGLGGAVVVLRGTAAVAVVPPPDVRVTDRSATLRFLGLQKAEAWALVDAFGTS